MDLIELKQQIEDLQRFSNPEVTGKIEALSWREITELSTDSRFIDRLEGDIRKLQEQLRKNFVDRDELIDMALACFIAHLPMIALGPPGTAKSLVFRQLATALGLQQKPIHIEKLQQEMQALIEETQGLPGGSALAAQPAREYFEYLVTRYTTPDELLGPANLDLMIKRALFYRQTGGLLPEAQVAFLDEIFKANSAILNALLSILNERLFYNAGRPAHVPLCMVFGASNEPPAEEELWALYDRFPVRVLCTPVDDTLDNLKKLLNTAMQHASNALLDGQQDAPVEQLATVNHFRLLHRLIQLRIGKTGSRFQEAHIDTFRALKREFQISDRSMFLLYRLCHALAVLRGREFPEFSELEVFKHCYRDPEAAPALADAVQDRIRSYTR